jgi:hypothetical protein
VAADAPAEEVGHDPEFADDRGEHEELAGGVGAGVHRADESGDTELTGLPMRIGPAEAAALGNAIVQGVAIGTFAALEEGRARIAS